MLKKISLASLVLFILMIGGATIWYSSYQTGPKATFLSNLGAVIITSGIFSMLGTYIARHKVSQELAQQFGDLLKLRISGVEGFGWWPLEIPRDARNVDMVVIRAHSWFIGNVPRIKLVLENGCKVRVCVVHPSSPIVPSLASKFDEAEETVRQKIQESLLTMVKCGEEVKRNNAPGKLLIKVHKLLPTHTYYRFDNTRYVVWYSLRRGRREVPLLKLTQGESSDFFREDFEGFLEDNLVDQAYNSEDTLLHGTGRIWLFLASRKPKSIGLSGHKSKSIPESSCCCCPTRPPLLNE